MSRFDYETAQMDLWDAGGDPDGLPFNNPQKRDEYLRKNGLNPKNYGSTLDSGKSNSGNASGSSGCFLTSACVQARGLPDDCEELMVLRHYRDTYLIERVGGSREIQEYYRIAPQIVESINAKENAKEIWNRVYEEMVLPCVRMIKAGAMEDTFHLYKSYTLQLADI